MIYIKTYKLVKNQFNFAKLEKLVKNYFKIIWIDTVIPFV